MDNLDKKEKTKKNWKIFFFVFLFISILSTLLFIPTFSSKNKIRPFRNYANPFELTDESTSGESGIEGKILDIDTGKPIEGGKIILNQFSKIDNGKLWSIETKSDENGRFSFFPGKPDIHISDNVINLIQCKHEEYINLYNAVPNYSISKTDMKKYRTFEIPTGKIKKLLIKLEKGGRLYGTLSYKKVNIILPLNHFEIQLKSSSLDRFYYLTKSDRNGKFSINGINPNPSYYIMVGVEGYFKRIDYDKFSILKGDNIEFNRILDLPGFYDTREISNLPKIK